MENKYILGIVVGIVFLIGVILAGANSNLFNSTNVELSEESTNYILRNSEPSLISQLNKSKQAINFTWNIQKSGAEENLDVTFDIINSTNTEFCIGFENKTLYLDGYKDDKDKDLKKVPIVKIKDDKNKLKIKADLDLDTLDENSKDCFIIEHEEDPQNVSFKIGWNSVTVSSIGESDSLIYAQSPIVRLDNGKLIVVFEDEVNDPTCAESSNDGVSWSVNELGSGATTVVNMNVATNGTRVYLLDVDSTPRDLQFAYSDNGCPTAGTGFTDFTDIQDVQSQYYDFKYNGIKDQYELCYADATSAERVYFANSSNPAGNSWTIKTIDTFTTTYGGCSLTIDDSGRTHMIYNDAGQSTLYYLNSTDNFNTYSISELSSGTLFTALDISSKGPNVTIGATNVNVINTYYSGNNGTSFYPSVWDANYNPTDLSICLEDGGKTYLVSRNDSAPTDSIFMTTYINGSGFTSNVSLESGTNAYRNAKVLCNNYPSSNTHRNNYLEYVFEDNTLDNILFGNYFIGDPLSAHTSAILTSSLGTNLTTENLTISLSGASGGQGSVIHNITDWRVNGSSIAVLNVPFFLEESPITDFSTNQFSGVISGNPTFNSSGQVGGAYDFDGTGDYINFTDGTIFNEFNGEFSIETWVNIDNFAVSGQNYIFSTCNIFNIGGFCLQVGDDHNYKFTVTNSSIFVRSLYSPAIQDSWQHVVGTYNGTDIKLYLNGSLVNSSYFPEVSGNSNNGYAVIGADYLGNQYFDGQISSLKVYNHSLSDEQIAYNYQRGLSGLHIDKIMSQETEVGQNWTANVTTTDLIEYGGSILSNPLLIVAEAGADTCTYSSGNWQIDCSDNCVISSPVDVGGNNISIIGTGKFITQSPITNFKELLIRGTDSSNICEVICDGACFE